MPASRPEAPPGAVLLATDLGSRSDRALDRALQLAEAWDARLHVVHAVYRADEMATAGRLWDAPWRELDDPRGEAERRLREDLGPRASTRQVEVHVEFGAPDEVVRTVAARENCGLILAGVARSETLGRKLLGDTVDRLLRKAEVPVLIVRARAHGPYDEIVGASDFSPASAEALAAALALFPGVPASLFHAYQIPFSGILMNDEICKEFADRGATAARQFLAAAGLDEDFPRIVECGSPEELLARHLAERPGGLVVVGSHGASALSDVLLGSTARRIIDALRGDVMVVPYSRRGE